MKITFRCVPKLAEVLPRPIPAMEGLPGWFRAMPSSMFSELRKEEIDTVKRCPPFVDAMSHGYLMLLSTDVWFKGGRFSWDREALGGRAPIDFHENIQVAGTPLFDADHAILKFNNFWTIETPPDYVVLITHPINRFDLPFTTVTGLIDSDRYNENFVNFPAYWNDVNFEVGLARGTPIAQCIPIKRETWEESFEIMDAAAGQRLIDISHEIDAGSGVYRKQYRA